MGAGPRPQDGVSVVGDMVVHMFQIPDYLADPPPKPTRLTPTGVKDLDSVTGGVLTGTAWVVTGLPRHGRSMMVTQIARLAAIEGVRVRFVLGYDGVSDTVARIQAASTRSSLQTARDEPTPPGDAEWARLPIEFDPHPDQSLTSLPQDGLLVIDDLDLRFSEPISALTSLQAWAGSSGRAVVVSLPRHLMHTDNPQQWQEWTRAADVIVHVDLRHEVDLTLQVLHHRRGPVAVIPADAAYARATIRNLP